MVVKGEWRFQVATEIEVGSGSNTRWSFVTIYEEDFQQVSRKDIDRLVEAAMKDNGGEYRRNRVQIHYSFNGYKGLVDVYDGNYARNSLWFQHVLRMHDVMDSVCEREIETNLRLQYGGNS